MKIEFLTREDLVAFLNSVLNLSAPFDFEVDGKKIEFFDLEKTDLSVLESMARAHKTVGYVITEKDFRRRWPSLMGPSTEAPSGKDHVGLPPLDPFYWALCVHDILKKDCTTCTLDRLVRTDPIAASQLKDAEYHNKWPELWPYVEEMERAAEHIMHVHRSIKEWTPPTEVEHRLTQARALLATAARRYSAALHDKLMSMRFK